MKKNSTQLRVFQNNHHPILLAPLWHHKQSELHGSHLHWKGEEIILLDFHLLFIIIHLFSNCSVNGVIKGYKVVYAPSELWFDDKSKDYKKTASSDTVLHGLKKYANYTIQILATTSGGDGVRSPPIYCTTDQDTPDAPTGVKALIMSKDSILVSWKPPVQPNGIIIKYKVYMKSSVEKETKEIEVPANQMSYEAAGLSENVYEFWVSAMTVSFNSS